LSWYEDINWIRKLFILELYFTVLLPSRLMSRYPIGFGLCVGVYLWISVAINYLVYFVFACWFTHVLMCNFAIAFGRYQNQTFCHFLEKCLYGKNHFSVWFGDSLHSTTPKCLAAALSVCLMSELEEIVLYFIESYMFNRSQEALIQQTTELMAGNNQLTPMEALGIAKELQEAHSLQAYIKSFISYIKG
jgi:hypothetical protein